MVRISKVIVMIWVLIPILTGCCDDCCDCPFPKTPCNQVIKGTIKNSDEMKNLEPFKGKLMVFKNASSYFINYVSSNIIIDSFAGIDCDTTFNYEKRLIKYVPDKISPKIYFEIGFVNTHQKDSFAECLTFNIGNFKNTVSINQDTIIPISAQILVNYIDSTDINSVKIKNAYHIRNYKLIPNEVNGFYYSLADGLLAFYIDEDYYWIRQ